MRLGRRGARPARREQREYRPDAAALQRVVEDLTGAMASAGVVGRPVVHAPLFAITARVGRRR